MSTRHDLALTWPDGTEETVLASGDETVLEAAESAGLELPFGCRTGACASCVARLVEGAVDYARPPRALWTPHVEAGYVLPCIARPRADCRIAVGAAVLTDLAQNPWE